jgi:hypothetical protein
MSWKTWGSVVFLSVLACTLLPAPAAAYQCSCGPSPTFYLEADVQGSTCPPLYWDLVYALNTQSDQDCKNRGYDRSCGDSATLHACRLENGTVHRYGFISYQCGYCSDWEPDQQPY